MCGLCVRANSHDLNPIMERVRLNEQREMDTVCITVYVVLRRCYYVPKLQRVSVLCHAVSGYLWRHGRYRILINKKIHRSILNYDGNVHDLMLASIHFLIDFRDYSFHWLTNQIILEYIEHDINVLCFVIHFVQACFRSGTTVSNVELHPKTFRVEGFTEIIIAHIHTG